MTSPDDRAKILVVDDEVEFCSLLQEYFKDQYTIKVAYDGREALRQIREFQPDCLLLDLRMPEMDGIAVLKSLKDSGSGIKVLVVTASGKMETAQECLELGALDYLIKPIELDEVAGKIQFALGNKKK